MGVSLTTVKAWMKRADHPLPSIQVGASGRHLRVVSDQIGPWLVSEAARKASTTSER